MTDTRPEHDAEIEVCGEVYIFRRTHDLLRRIEQRFGPLVPLARRVEAFAVTQFELAGLYEEIVRGDAARPGRLGLERWLWDEGTPKLCTPLAKVLYELTVGNKTLRLIEEEKRITAAEQRDREAAARPTDPPDHGSAERIKALGEALAKAMQTA